MFHFYRFSYFLHKHCIIAYIVMYRRPTLSSTTSIIICNEMAGIMTYHVHYHHNADFLDDHTSLFNDTNFDCFDNNIRHSTANVSACSGQAEQPVGLVRLMFLRVPIWSNVFTLFTSLPYSLYSGMIAEEFLTK